MGGVVIRGGGVLIGVVEGVIEIQFFFFRFCGGREAAYMEKMSDVAEMAF